jgi:hypothetical protein
MDKVDREWDGAKFSRAYVGKTNSANQRIMQYWNDANQANQRGGITLVFKLSGLSKIHPGGFPDAIIQYSTLAHGAMVI